MTRRITGIFAMGALVALAALIFNPAAMAANHGQGHGQGAHAGAQMGGCSGWGGAALTPEQQEKAQALFTEFQQKTATLHRELYAKQAMLNAELVALTPDSKRVDALVAEVSDLRTKLFTERVALRKAMTEAGLPAMGGMGMGMGGKHGGMRGGGMMMGCN
ncbi:periplasmic heavy metal sensor [Desulfocurvus vexinensis]|uniref:periplasmic heavy metal sensor n=1 Tax=Desulfocurvus vexinensis TaxID=399548 RepID=UPI0004B8603D|nr:periplasmic heavy metal sensor [Desulfocurvus vexinensis]